MLFYRVSGARVKFCMAQKLVSHLLRSQTCSHLPFLGWGVFTPHVCYVACEGGSRQGRFGVCLGQDVVCVWSVRGLRVVCSWSVCGLMRSIRFNDVSRFGVHGSWWGGAWRWCVARRGEAKRGEAWRGEVGRRGAQRGFRGRAGSGQGAHLLALIMLS